MRDMTMFLAAAGGVSAVLLVWAQLWTEPGTVNRIPEAASRLGQAWTYISVLFSLLAFAWAAGLG